MAVIHGEQKDTEESGLEDGRQSPPPMHESEERNKEEPNEGFAFEFFPSMLIFRA